MSFRKAEFIQIFWVTVLNGLLVGFSPLPFSCFRLILASVRDTNRPLRSGVLQTWANVPFGAGAERTDRWLQTM